MPVSCAKARGGHPGREDASTRHGRVGIDHREATERSLDEACADLCDADLEAVARFAAYLANALDGDDVERSGPSAAPDGARGARVTKTRLRATTRRPTRPPSAEVR
jgi:hypothetical protein